MNTVQVSSFSLLLLILVNGRASALIYPSIWGRGPSVSSLLHKQLCAKEQKQGCQQECKAVSGCRATKQGVSDFRGQSPADNALLEEAS